MKAFRHHGVLSSPADLHPSSKAVARAGYTAAFAFLLVTSLPFAAHAQTACANPAFGYTGFGRNTTGGVTTGAPGEPVVYHVTNLNDYLPGATPIPGSLRAALEEGTPEGNRCIVFDVGGTIELLPPGPSPTCAGQPGHISGLILVKGPNVTIDGFSAPSPGITLKNWGFSLHGPIRGVENVIVRGIRIRDTVWPECAGADGFEIVGLNNFVIDHVSVARWGDGSLDIAGDDSGIPSQNGTVQWSIIGKGNTGSWPDGKDTSMFVKYWSGRISIHHNLFINANDRNPYIAWSDNPDENPTEIVADVRNTLVWNYGWTGTSVRHNGWANVVHNYYFSSASPTADAALYRPDVDVDGMPYDNRAYAKGNFSPTNLNIDAEGNQPAPFYSDPVRTTGAVTAAHQILAQAGARGPNFSLDLTDQNYVNQISADPMLRPLPTTYKEDDPTITYTGTWSAFGRESGDFSDDRMVSSNAAGSTATFSFTGTGVTWLGVRSVLSGIANVSIDGGAPSSVDMAGPPLPPDSLTSEPVFSASGLASGVTHTMMITVTGNTTSGGTHIPVDGFEVTP